MIYCQTFYSKYSCFFLFISCRSPWTLTMMWVMRTPQICLTQTMWSCVSMTRYTVNLLLFIMCRLESVCLYQSTWSYILSNFTRDYNVTMYLYFKSVFQHEVILSFHKRPQYNILYLNFYRGFVKGKYW